VLPAAAAAAAFGKTALSITTASVWIPQALIPGEPANCPEVSTWNLPAVGQPVPEGVQGPMRRYVPEMSADQFPRPPRPTMPISTAELAGAEDSLRQQLACPVPGGRPQEGAAVCYISHKVPLTIEIA
jgi:hypothetical protein